MEVRGEPPRQPRKPWSRLERRLLIALLIMSLTYLLAVTALILSS